MFPLCLHLIVAVGAQTQKKIEKMTLALLLTLPHSFIHLRIYNVLRTAHIDQSRFDVRRDAAHEKTQQQNV